MYLVQMDGKVLGFSYLNNLVFESIFYLTISLFIISFFPVSLFLFHVSTSTYLFPLLPSLPLMQAPLMTLFLRPEPAPGPRQLPHILPLLLDSCSLPSSSPRLPHRLVVSSSSPPSSRLIF